MSELKGLGTKEFSGHDPAQPRISERLYSDRATERVLLRLQQEARHKLRARKMLSLVSLGSTLAAVFSAAFVAVSALNIEYAPFIILVAAGILSSSIANFFKGQLEDEVDVELETRRRDDERFQLVREWNAFEKISRGGVAKQSRRNHDSSLSDLLAELSENGTIGKVDGDVIHEALKRRNLIVHSGTSGLARSEELLLQERLSEINRLLLSKARASEERVRAIKENSTR